MTTTTKAVSWILGIALVAVLGFVFFASRGDDAGTDTTASSTTNVICTMDAKMCPDGTYVGRTGPNCEFVCPNGTSTTGANGSTGAGMGNGSTYYPADMAK